MIIIDITINDDLVVSIKSGVPPVLIPIFVAFFQMFSKQLLGYPHDYGNPHVVIRQAELAIG